MRLNVASGEGIVVGDVTYPEYEELVLAGSENVLGVYDGQVEIAVSLAASPSATPGEHRVPALMSYQGCHRNVCLMPDSVNLEIPVTVVE
jgi:hypothetical protein